MVVGRDQACERTYQPPPNLRETVQFFSNRVVKLRPAWHRRCQRKHFCLHAIEGLCECSVLDVSPGGAKIVTDVEIDIHDRFVLALVPNHPRSQQCEVVWRRGNTLGVKFVA